MRRQAAALSLACLLLLFATAAALALTGDLTQPGGTAGCVSETGAGPCANGHALVTPYSVVVSPDSRSVYLASNGSNAVARFIRSATTGRSPSPPAPWRALPAPPEDLHQARARAVRR